jgi:hypothetical protein
MATLLNSLNTVGNKLPAALGLLLVDWVHNSPLLHGSRADALHPPVLPDKLPEGGFYAVTKAAAGRNSSSSVGLWRSTVSAAVTAWSELLAGLSAGARLFWLGCIWLPALLFAPAMMCGSPAGRVWWLGLMTLSLEASGPAFIKWGQVGGALDSSACGHICVDGSLTVTKTAWQQAESVVCILSSNIVGLKQL